MNHEYKTLSLVDRLTKQTYLSGFIPGILAIEKDRVPVFLNKKEVLALQKTRHLLGEMLQIEDNFFADKIKCKHVLVQDVSFDPITNEAMHIDLLACKPNQIIRSWMPIFYYNCEKSPGTKQDAVFHILHKKVRIEAQFSDFPRRIRFDLSKHESGQCITAQELINDLVGVKLLNPSTGSVVSKFVGRRSRAVAAQ